VQEVAKPLVRQREMMMMLRAVLLQAASPLSARPLPASDA
jgi:hypothetical protein